MFGCPACVSHRESADNDSSLPLILWLTWSLRQSTAATSSGLFDLVYNRATGSYMRTMRRLTVYTMAKTKRFLTMCISTVWPHGTHLFQHDSPEERGHALVCLVEEQRQSSIADQRLHAQSKDRKQGGE